MKGTNDTPGDRRARYGATDISRGKGYAMEPWEYPGWSSATRSWVAGTTIVVTVLVGYGTAVWFLSNAAYGKAAFMAFVLWVIFDVELTVLPPWAMDTDDE